MSAPFSITEREAFNAILRDDLSSFIAKAFVTVTGNQDFIPTWYINLIADYLTWTVSGEITRLVINMPPRSLKSICVSVAYVAWVLGHNPSAKFVCASYADDLARKFARDCRKVIMSPWYKEIFPGTVISRTKSAEGDFETTLSGGRFTTSVSGAVTGRGGDYLIIDDPIKPQDAFSDIRRKSTNDWYDNTLYSRLDDKRHGVIILTMQRLHEDDLTGHILGKRQGIWEQICLPAIATEDEEFYLVNGRRVGRKTGEALHPEREPLEVLEDLKQSVGSFNFASQYQQAPVPLTGNLIKWHWFKTHNGSPPVGSNQQIVQSWDTAFTENDGSDWSVATTWLADGKSYYLIDVFRERLDFPTLKRSVISHQKQWNANTVLIEDIGTGAALIQQLNSEYKNSVIGIKPEGSKTDRMSAQSAIIEAGQVFLPTTAPWLAAFQSELLAFPYGKYDDQVDSVSQFLKWVDNRRATVRIVHVRI